MDKVFISFSSKDDKYVDLIIKRFQQEKVDYWVSKESIALGTKYAETITAAIKECAYFLVLLSRNSNMSQHVSNEINIAVINNKIIIPVILDDVALSPSMEYYISSYQWLRWDSENSVDTIINRIRKESGEETIGIEIRRTPVVGPCNSPDEEYNRGHSYFYGTDGYEKSADDAVYWYKKAANHGNEKAACNLGWCYESGIGVDQSWEKAYHWYQISAKSGNPMALYSIGWMHEQGIYVSRNLQKAFEYFMASATAGNSIAQYKVGLAYQEGTFVSLDYVEANRWFQLAAEQSHVAAQYMLAENFYFGRGTQRDVIKAKNMWLLSSEMGYMKSHEALEKYYDIFYNSIKKSFDV